MKNSLPFRLLNRSLIAAGALILGLGNACAAEVKSFAPQNEAKRVRQVTIVFSAPVRALGDLDGPAPLVWKCTGTNIPAHGRWVDTQSWALEFEKQLPAGVSCEFKPAANFTDGEGKPVKMAEAYRFNTGGPNIVSIFAGNSYRGIDEDAVFLVQAASAIEFSTVEANTWCEIEGIGEKIPVHLLADKDKTPLLALYFKNEDPNRVAALRCARSLPAGGKVKFVWGKGIRGAGGFATTANEQREFNVRAEFTVTVSCERETADAGCIPFTPISLFFSERVSRADVKKLRLVHPDGKAEAPTLVADDDESREFIDRVQFKPPFAVNSKFTLQVPPQIHDEDGRLLANRDRLAQVEIRTGSILPLLKFAADFGVIERNAGGLLPATLRNLEAYTGDASATAADGSKPGTAAKVRMLRLTTDDEVFEWMAKMRAHSLEKMPPNSDVRAFSFLKDEPRAKLALLPKPHGPQPMEVVGIPLGAPGYYFVEAESTLLGSHLMAPGMTMYVQTVAVNTNLSVHFKNGVENQLVWVTALDTGAPVPNAKISIRTCDGKQIAFGTTGADGAMPVRRRLPPNTHCDNDIYGYYISARLAKDGVEDFAYVLSGWQKGIEPWRFKLPFAGVVPSVMTHTVFDRPLFRTGETVHMKHFARRHTTQGFAFAPAAQLPAKIQIQLDGSETKYELPLTWKNGVAESVWTIPADAKLGRYNVDFVVAAKGQTAASDNDAEDGEDWGPSGRYWQGGSFKVGEFRLPVLKGEVIGAANPAVAVRQVDVDLKLAYLAGGAAGGEKVRVRSEMRAANLKTPVEFENLNFGAAPIDPKKLEAPGWDFGAAIESEIFDDQRDLALDKAGTRRATVDKVPQWMVPADVYTEMEYSDPSGEIHTASASSPWFPAAVVAGVGAEGWANANDGVQLKIAVLDTALKPKAGAAYSVHAWLRKALVHRKRMIGGFYSYDTKYQAVDLGEVCKGETDAKGAAACLYKPADKKLPGGQIVLEARADDAEGRASFARASVWLVAGNEIWFEQDDSDRIDVIPEKRRYEAGDTAVFQVRMPFREATALVTVEREGVIDRFVTHLSGKQPTVSVPIKANYGPNAFVSVFVVRGRVGNVQPTALVDLGRPAYKLGIAEITVGRKGYELKVKVTTDKPVYLVREQAVAKIQVTRPDGSPAKGGEIALAAVDEALLELARNDSWQLLDRMMARRGYQVETSTAQSQVIGKRHFGLKAMPAGGGGGRQPTRELFDTLIKWEPRVILDDNGEATVTLPLNDSLTTIRVVAIASQGSGLFGTGFTRLRSTKDVQLFSGLPPLVRDGDQFRAGITLRNLGEHKDKFTVTPTASALVNGMVTPLGGLGGKEIELAPGEAREFTWPVTVPKQASRIDWRATAVAAGGAQDSLKVTQSVVPAIPVRVQAAMLEQLDDHLSEPVKLVAGAEPGRGSVDVFVKARLGASSDSVKQYMQSYPYSCLEQKVSKAIGTADRRAWDSVAGQMPVYLDSDGLAWYFPSPREGWGSDVLTSYILSVANEAGYPIPDETSARMLTALDAYVQGRIKRKSYDEWSHRPDLPTRKLLAIEALSRYGKATPAHLATVEISPGLWPTAAVVAWLDILQRVHDVPDRAKRIAEAEAILRTRMVASGTLTQFANEGEDYWWWMMMSPDNTAVRAVSALMDSPDWQREIPRLLRGVMSRQKEGRWNTTPANAWGVAMLDKFAQKYESAPVTGQTRITLSGSATPAQTADWTKINAAHARPDANAPVPIAGTAWRNAGDAFRFDWPASGSGTVELKQEGEGKPWVTIQTLATRKLTSPLYAGFNVTKNVTPVEQRVPGKWSKGDVVRVTLTLNAPTSWSWVVIDDPVPAGSSILGNSDLDSQLADKSGNAARGPQPSFVERGFAGYRAYFEYLPKGAATVEYRYRVNNPGEFGLPPTRVEAMYAPENFGETPNANVRVE
jgi:uncharacterized protein YfaS (alpha-2-macroglobulin family)